MLLFTCHMFFCFCFVFSSSFLGQSGHRASASPGYGTQPNHWHQTQKKPKLCQKVHIKRVKKRWFQFYYLYTSRESLSPVCRIFWVNFISTTIIKQPPLSLASIISQVLPSSARLPEDFFHLGKGEGNENREVEKDEVEERIGWVEGEDRDGGRGGRTWVCW